MAEGMEGAVGCLRGEGLRAQTGVGDRRNTVDMSTSEGTAAGTEGLRLWLSLHGWRGGSRSGRRRQGRRWERPPGKQERNVSGLRDKNGGCGESERVPLGWKSIGEDMQMMQERNGGDGLWAGGILRRLERAGRRVHGSSTRLLPSRCNVPGC